MPSTTNTSITIEDLVTGEVTTSECLTLADSSEVLVFTIALDLLREDQSKMRAVLAATRATGISIRRCNEIVTHIFNACNQE